MLDLLKDIDFTLNAVLWILSISFMTASVIACAVLSLRRIIRNRINNYRLKEQSNFESALNIALKQDVNAIHNMDFSLGHTAGITEVLLRYFRMLAGKRVDSLRTVIEHLQIESQIEEATKFGTTGRRMEAMQILSYLNSQSSLLTIHEGLSSSNKYIRLTAARCLTRRKADVFTNDIIYFINSAFPDEDKLLADILFHFGLKITDILESYVNSDCNTCIKAACLQALTLMMPPSTILDIDRLIENPDERIRAAALTLSNVTSHNAKSDILIKALEDKSVKVKIIAAKMAHDKRRTDTISHLYDLTQDSLLWVRYWAVKAIWNTGRQGKKLIETMGRGDAPSARMAREASLEFRSLDQA